MKREALRDRVALLAAEVRFPPTELTVSRAESTRELLEQRGILCYDVLLLGEHPGGIVFFTKQDARVARLTLKNDGHTETHLYHDGYLAAVGVRTPAVGVRLLVRFLKAD